MCSNSISSETILISKQSIMMSDEIYYRVSGYGFIERADIITFLKCACGKPLDYSALLWIQEKVRRCLYLHDNDTQYFERLRRLKHEMSITISHCFINI